MKKTEQIYLHFKAYTITSCSIILTYNSYIISYIYIIRQFPCFGTLINLVPSMKREVKLDILEKNNHNFAFLQIKMCDISRCKCYQEVIFGADIK